MTIGSTTDLILTFQDNPTLIHDLKPLAQIKFVKDNLYLNRNPRLITLDGLQNIDTVGSLLIFENDSLMNIDHLNLKSVENIKFQKLSNLKSIQGLKNITNIGVLSLFKLPKLISLEGLNNLEKVQNLDFRHLFVTLNNLEKLRSVKGNLFIAECPNVTNFLPLTSFNDTIIGWLGIAQEVKMSMLGLESVKKLYNFQLNYWDIQSTSNLNIDVHGLQNVKSIGSFIGSGDLRPMVNLDSILMYDLYFVDTNKSYLLLNSLPVMGDLSLNNNPNLSNIDFLNEVKKS